jgi:peptidoglycan/LPS O-acetylase OafA/YrhL
MPSVDHDEIREAPPVVICAVAAGVAPLPFLAVYAVLFISRGTVHPVTPPDIGDSKTTELIAGLVALVLFIIGALAALWLLDGRRRWPFVVGQLALLATAVDFVIDSTTGSPAIPIVLGLTSLTALVLVALPATWEHMDRDMPDWMRRGRADSASTAPAATQERIP